MVRKIHNAGLSGAYAHAVTGKPVIVAGNNTLVQYVRHQQRMVQYAHQFQHYPPMVNIGPARNSRGEWRTLEEVVRVWYGNRASSFLQAPRLPQAEFLDKWIMYIINGEQDLRGF